MRHLLIGLLGTTVLLTHLCDVNAEEVERVEVTKTKEVRPSLVTGDELQALYAKGGITVIMAMDAASTQLRQIGAIPEFPIINSPEVSPDGKWIGVDGWKQGQNLTDAHILLIEIETGVVLDLGLGAMPTWSADGKLIAFSRYRRSDGSPHGVFVGSVDQQRERLIDADGWAITWSPDGQKLVYVKGRNLLVYDPVFETQHAVFGDGESPYRRIMHNPEWSPDSRRIGFLAIRNDGTPEFATVLAIGPDPDLQVCCDARGFNPDIGWTKDGRRLTVPGQLAPQKRSQIYTVSPTGDQLPSPLPGQPVDASNSGNDWAPDGKTLYFLSRK
ncbi:TolB family protein [Fuerstiella marisgermanici]|uniref:Translocation protein n=1 Tax=Fuerstiella marisgermanici TaxID=1891926 RepID=A0A1P8WM47_9PLAN|nr:PD40 domain-containing protein [Fuerstiella marisgermanici]APZ95143.1 translocation protein [Fuerstiella marisgermanici]